ncbi:hypothetical protein HK101_006752, partial [Irineochytrium annulatum]
ATNACLASDVAVGSTVESVEALTREHGHSTPQMAGSWAKKVGARKLVLNHFSSRYSGASDEESLAVMEEIRALAVQEFGGDVDVARDFTVVSVPRRKD